MSRKPIVIHESKGVNSLSNEPQKCTCPKGTIKYSVFIKDKNNNKLCSICKKIEVLKGNFIFNKLSLLKMSDELKNKIKEYIIMRIEKTIHYRNTSLKGTKSKFKVGYTPKSFQLYLEEKGVTVHINYIEEVFREVYNTIKYEPSEEKRKSILSSD